ncbi:MAG: GNAT family N-acetyltransferase [Saprospiraceae bacterium]|nr:GNAT family N-acetyltransferase [Saprospiraceae bacterium]
MANITLAETTQDLKGILDLQRRNLTRNLSEEEVKSEGFVTVEHDLDLITRMNTAEKSVVAKSKDVVIGYTLAMTPVFASDIPILSHMFDQFGHSHYQGKPIKEAHFIICGQVCVDKDFRGQKIMDRMYALYRDTYKSRYAFVITEIADHNPRSLHAHLRVGFQIIHSYSSGKGIVWHLVLWDWNTS